MEQKAKLQIQNVGKQFGRVTALHDINLDVYDSELLAIVGPSGSGKSTLIRLLVGMEGPSQGTILLNGAVLNNIPASKRPTCMVFQSLALFPHMTVGENIEFPLRIKGLKPDKRYERAVELLDLLHLPREYYSNRINQCSGGEQQRVALARALAFDPDILFFDEPLSALDYRLRKYLEKEIKSLQQRTQKTFVYITHSLEEAMVMSDRIAILHDGRLVQVDVADEIYLRPNSRFVAQFMGEVNFFEVNGGDNGTLMADLSSLRIDGFFGDIAAGERSTLMIRPEFIRFLEEKETADCVVKGVVTEQFEYGSRIQYEVKTEEGQTIIVEKLRENRFEGRVRDRAILGWALSNCHVIKDGRKAA